ncbi:hypothetical protein [Pseudochryseolinea flava]|uniref:Uncharacterized protein n=1 Tax=Pseudochryseolinea flava TaxID=2059302 RepID=A0A364Y0D7_9BACT|nr:hypothetical protein [Pseudochryseolinea flava]RAW00115.1 hypothetical protein DQQ10_16325 [Pseudochryseolinea flava]
MKIILTTSLVLFSSVSLLAQRDPTVPDTVDDRVANQASWYNDTLPNDLPPHRDSTLVNVNNLPQKLKKALSSKDEYGGWEKGKIYYDHPTKIYKVHIANGNDVRIYGFTPDGHPVSFRAFRKQF